MNVRMKVLKFSKDKNIDNINFDSKTGFTWECCQIPDFVKKLMETITSYRKCIQILQAKREYY